MRGLRARVAWTSWQFPPIPQSRPEYHALLEALGLQNDCVPHEGTTRDVVSLGSTCFTARFMSEHGLRTAAGPLDWVFSDGRMAAHMLDNDFASFMDPSQYQRREGGRLGHVTYSGMIGRAIFNHHDPLGSPVDLEYFRRCVARLRTVLASPRRKLFLLVSKEAADLSSLRCAASPPTPPVSAC